MFPLLLAVSAVLAWDPVLDPEIALYRLYVGIQSMAAGNPPLLGYTIAVPDTEFTVDGLDYGTTYFFDVTSVTFAGLESGYSNEIIYTPRHGHGNH